ncbi:hypothetical protein [Rhabdochromatium marinum]|uniref:hypothetical protein n=1 Tax=Rhabdochromatium marinum TaxID=48729 RepID=UPI00190861C1|nr:hypothetical protein [Rhabdochromatium marinum]
MKKSFWRHLLGLGLIVYAIASIGGNSALMAENANGLLQLSDEIAGSVLPSDAEGDYRFSGRVVGDNSIRDVQIGGVRRLSRLAREISANSRRKEKGGQPLIRPFLFVPSVLSMNDRYQSLIRLGTIPAPIMEIGIRQNIWRRVVSVNSGTETKAVNEQKLEIPVIFPDGGHMLDSW